MIKRCMARMMDLESQTLTDYGLLLALIAVVCAGALTMFGDGIAPDLDSFVDRLIFPR